MQDFKVLREHYGDKPYVQGDTRTARADDVAHLVRNGVLAPVENKAEAVPENKAKSRRKQAE